MEMLLVFLSTAIGTVVGVAAVMMLQRKDRKTAAGGGSVLRTQLQNTEWALASAGRDVEELRHKLDEHEKAAHNVAQELESARRRLLDAAVENEREATRRTEAERLEAEASAQAQSLAERVRQLETASSELEQALSRAQALETQLTGLRQAGTEADAHNSALADQLAAERQKTATLASDLDAIEREHAALQAVLRRHREVAAEGIELLQRVQAKLGGATGEDPAGAAKAAVNGSAVNGFAHVG
jgi:chromosome segregation ATPase